MKNIFVTSRQYVENGMFSHWENPHVIISVSDPNQYTPHIPQNDACLDVVYLKFHDLDNMNAGGGLYTLMEENDAKGVVDTIVEQDNALDGELDVLIHCEAGLSRSAGIGKALQYISRHFLKKEVNLDSNTAGDFFFYNRHVYSIVLNYYAHNYAK